MSIKETSRTVTANFDGFSSTLKNLINPYSTPKPAPRTNESKKARDCWAKVNSTPVTSAKQL